MGLFDFLKAADINQGLQQYRDTPGALLIDVREADDPDKEPLEKQAEYARAASEQLERERSGGRAAEREPRFQENRSK